MEVMENTRKLDDIEHELERDKPWNEHSRRLLYELADSFTAQEQLKNKGKLIGSFKTNKSGMYYRIAFAVIVALASVALLKVSFYFVIFSVIIVMILSVWLLRCIRKFQMGIDIYENAIIGRVEFSHEKNLRKLENGIAYYKFAHEKAGCVYIVLYNDTVCRLRYMKDGKKIAYLLNKQKGKEKHGKMG